MGKHIYLGSPTMHGEEFQYVKEAFDKNWIAPVGFNLDELEKQVNEYMTEGSDHPWYTCAVVSGTSALHLCAMLAGVKQGDTVLVSDATYCATAFPLAYEKANLVFVDSERESWNMDPAALELAFQKHPETKFVMVAHLYGTPANMDAIREVCDRHSAIIIEDAAEGMGSLYKGRKCGTLGDYNAISFNGNKIITTSMGGMVIAKDKATRDEALNLATQAREPVVWFEHAKLGNNYRMSNVLAGIGRGQMPHLYEHRALKRKLYDTYKEAFENLPVTMNPIPDWCESNYWLSAILIDKDCKVKPMDVLQAMLKIADAEGRPTWKPMSLQPVFKDCECVHVEDYPVGYDLYDRGLCLPSDIKNTDEDMELIIKAVKSCF
ncbi:MAG: aminotransferase class I/II-fold pyridoxal phosphate-dependent enzyme [Lachnospiraceae bacterium]|nr:aminotransferase class I/II-fold pyridoxal phosphate-dependent enzyme [Candidatus Darwinimomas equi]